MDSERTEVSLSDRVSTLEEAVKDQQSTIGHQESTIEFLTKKLEEQPASVKRLNARFLELSDKPTQSSGSQATPSDDLPSGWERLER